VDAAQAEEEGRTLEELIETDPVSGLKTLPHWLAQPYFRPVKGPQNAPVREKQILPTIMSSGGPHSAAMEDSSEEASAVHSPNMVLSASA
jgi:hypothetical protein